MKCSQCASTETKVIESRDVTNGESIRRRRECTACHHRFTTYERVERPTLVVIKNNGTRELFSREKLMGGLYKVRKSEALTVPTADHLSQRRANAVSNLGQFG